MELLLATGNMHKVRELGQLLDGLDLTIRSTLEYPGHPEIEERLTRNEKRDFFTTDDPERFKSFGEKFLGKKIPEVQTISL